MTSTFAPSVRAPRSPPRRWCRSTASRRRTRRRRCRPSCRRAAGPSSCAARAPAPAAGRPACRSARRRSRGAWPRAAGRASGPRRAAAAPCARCLQALDEPRVDAGALRATSSMSAPRRRAASTPTGARPSLREGARRLVRPARVLPQQRPPADLQAAHRLLQRRLEAAVDRHDLARRLHLRAELAVAEGELVEGPARDLHDAVVERRLEGGGGAARDGVRDLVERACRSRSSRRRGRSGSRSPSRRAPRCATRAG